MFAAFGMVYGLETPLVIVDATTEPISLQEFKDHSRITITDSGQDGLISNIFIPAARRWLEAQLGRTFHEQTLEEHLQYWPSASGAGYYNGSIILRHATPLISITSVTLVDSGGNSSIWAASNYIADIYRQVGRLTPAFGVYYPSFDPYPVSPIRIRYKAGIVTASPVTDAAADVKYVMNLLVRGMFDNRESENITQDRIHDISMKYGVEAFMAKMKAEYAF